MTYKYDIKDSSDSSDENDKYVEYIGVLRRRYGIRLPARRTSTGKLNNALDNRQEFEGSYLDIKSTTMRDSLQKVLEGVTCISLREDKPSVSTSFKNDSYQWFS